MRNLYESSLLIFTELYIFIIDQSFSKLAKCLILTTIFEKIPDLDFKYFG